VFVVGRAPAKGLLIRLENNTALRGPNRENRIPIQEHSF